MLAKEIFPNVFIVASPDTAPLHPRRPQGAARCVDHEQPTTADAQQGAGFTERVASSCTATTPLDDRCA
jgi:hypothetical protein